MIETLALKNLKDIKNILDRADVIYWLECGTLLGAVRDGKIIPWDSDMDLGMFSSDLDKILPLFPEFRKKMFNVRYTECGIKLFRYNISLDIYLNNVYGEYFKIIWIKPISTISRMLYIIVGTLSYEVYVRPQLELNLYLIKELFSIRNSDEIKKSTVNIIKYLFSFLPFIRKRLFNLVYFLFRKSNYTFHHLLFPKHYYEKLGFIEFYGMKFNIPSDVDEYLTYRYGKDWRIQKKNWNSIRDDGSIVR